MRRSTTAAVMLLTATLLEILVMAHHPRVRTLDVAAAVQQISQLRYLSGWVHGVAMAAMLCIAYSLVEFTWSRGVQRPWIRAGSIAYGAGVLFMMGASLMSGFVLPDMVAFTPHVSAVDLAANSQLMILCSALNQSCAAVATVAISAGIFCWSLDLVRERAALRLLGLFGLLVGVLPAAGLISGSLHLDVHGMSEVVWLQALWNCGVAMALLRPGIAPTAGMAPLLNSNANNAMPACNKSKTTIRLDIGISDATIKSQ